MFRIADGREQFYQWDLDRQIIVEDKSIVEVHFCNRTDDCSLVTEVVDGLANVPNILLQSSFDIRVFGYDGKATLHDKKFKVNARTRPADYVYTETEVLSIKQLEEELRNDIDERFVNIIDEVVELIPEPDLSNYYTKNEVDNAIAAIEVPEIDLSNYYTKEEVTTAIHNSKNVYFLDFSVLDAFWPAREYDADAEMTEYAERKSNGEAVSAYIRLGERLNAPYSGWVPATERTDSSDLILSSALIDVEALNTGYGIRYPRVRLQYKEDKWIYRYDYNNDYWLKGYATEQYVNNAITTAFAGIATAEGSAY